MHHAHVRQHPRGYLLIEAMIGGAIASIALFAALGFVAQARTETRAAGNRATAMQLARGQAELIAAELPATAPSQGMQAVTGVTGFRMSFTTTSGSLPGVTTSDVRDINVTVEYPCATGSREDNETAPAGDGRASVSLHRTWVADP